MWKVQSKLYLKNCWKKYLFLVVVIILYCFYFQTLIKGYCIRMGIQYEMHVANYIADFFRGTIPYAMIDHKEPFTIPPFWALYFIYFLLITAHMLNTDGKYFSQQMILRCETRRKWWVSKNIQILIECTGYISVTLLTFVIYGLCTGAKVGGINYEVLTGYCGVDILQDETSHVLIKLLVSIFFTMLALVYIQFVVEIISNIIVGFILQIAILAVSVYYFHPLLIGNHMMLLREEMLIQSGHDLVYQVIYCVIVIILMDIVGYKLIANKDLF